MKRTILITLFSSCAVAGAACMEEPGIAEGRAQLRSDGMPCSTSGGSPCPCPCPCGAPACDGDPVSGGGSIGGGTGGGGPANSDPGQCTFVFGYEACVVPNGSVPATWGSREQWWCCTWTGCRTEWGICVPNDWD